MSARKMQLKRMPAFLRPRTKFKPNLREPIASWAIVKGDKVGVVDGPCKGQQGIVVAVLREAKRIVVEGVNMVRPRVTRRRLRCWGLVGPAATAGSGGTALKRA